MKNLKKEFWKEYSTKIMLKLPDKTDTILRVTELKNRYVTDGNIWTIDERVFNKNLYVFLIFNIQTRALLGYRIGHKPVKSDSIVELYKLIFEKFQVQSPLIIHSDAETEYTTPQIQKLCEEENIRISVGSAEKDQNQVSEAVNDKIKYYTILNILEKPKRTRPYRAFVTNQPNQFKGRSATSKAKSKDYRKWFFQTEFFSNQAFQAIESAINTYNQKDLTKESITRQEADYSNTKIAGTPIEKFYLLKSTDDYANQIKRINIESITEARTKLADILQSSLSVDQKLVAIQALLIERQGSTNDLLIAGFTSVFAQNSELLDVNKELKDEVHFLQNQSQSLLEKLEKLTLEKQEKENRKNKRAKRKRLPKRDPITPDIYQLLIENIRGTNYESARLRIAILLLTVTGIRINELLPLKVEQLYTLVKSSWIAINRSKRGPSSHKAFLTQEGKKLIRHRQKDFEIIFAMKNDDAYIFTSGSNHYQQLRRETLTKEINKVTRKVAESLPEKPNITSHSFRVGFITQLWKDTKDIEFVRQAIGHIRVESTSSYVENLSDQERQKRMLQVKSPED